MPIHVGELHSELALVDDELPLSERQLAKLVDLVAKRLAEVGRAGGDERQLPRRSAIPRLKVRG